MDERGTRTLTESLSAAVEAALLEVRTATPARVESYDASEQRATVLPLLKRKSAAGVVLPPKPIGNVPVLHPRAGGFAMTLPVATGDTGLLLCSDRSLDLWLAQTDTDGDQVDPQSRRHHQMTDAIFLPGLRHWAGVPAAVAGTDPADDLVIAAEDGSSYIILRPDGEVRIKGSAVRLGNPAAAAALALATLVNTQLSTLATALSTGWVVVPGDGGAALKAAVAAIIATGWPADVAATKVFGE